VDILNIDQKALQAVNHFFVGKSPILDSVVKGVAVYSIYVVPVLLIVLWFTAKKHREALFLAFISTIFSWLVMTKEIASHLWYRARPDLAVLNIKEVIFHRPDYSFPSDHATALFALTFSLYIFGYKKAAYWFLAIAILVSITRVAVGVHFPLDILGGIACAALGTWVIYLLRKPILKYLFKPVVAVLKLVRLA
jgi:undecaprenyl-diphosphatase